MFADDLAACRKLEVKSALICSVCIFNRIMKTIAKPSDPGSNNRVLCKIRLSKIETGEGTSLKQHKVKSKDKRHRFNCVDCIHKYYTAISAKPRSADDFPETVINIAWKTISECRHNTRKQHKSVGVTSDRVDDTQTSDISDGEFIAEDEVSKAIPAAQSESKPVNVPSHSSGSVSLAQEPYYPELNAVAGGTGIKAVQPTSNFFPDEDYPDLTADLYLPQLGLDDLRYLESNLLEEHSAKQFPSFSKPECTEASTSKPFDFLDFLQNTQIRPVAKKNLSVLKQL